MHYTVRGGVDEHHNITTSSEGTPEENNRIMVHRK